MRNLTYSEMAEFWWQMFDAADDDSVPLEQYMEIHNNAVHYQLLYEESCIIPEWDDIPF